MTPTEQAEAANFLAQLATIPGFDHPDLHRWVAALRAAPQAAPAAPAAECNCRTGECENNVPHERCRLTREIRENHAENRRTELRAALETDVQSLAMTIRRLVSSLNKHCPHVRRNDDMQSQAMAMLERMGLQGSVLRDDETPKTDAARGAA